VRPAWTARTFSDEAGHAIDYGNRWHEGPPERAYEVTSNLDRFVPLHAVADALVECLLRDYRVVASEAQDLARILEPEPPDFIRQVRLDPEETGGEPMTIVFTSFPGVVVYSGSRLVESFPACGCDACDDSVDQVADRMQERVLSLASDDHRWSRRA